MQSVTGVTHTKYTVIEAIAEKIQCYVKPVLFVNLTLMQT